MTRLAFLFDVDNTLIDNDRAKTDIASRVEAIVGPEGSKAFWDLYEQVRRELDYVDLIYTLSRYRAAYPDDGQFPYLADMILGFPWGDYLFPGAHEAIEHLKSFGQVGILSDGDPVFQAAKIARAGLAKAVGEQVFIYVHKEEHLSEVLEKLPADLYVLIDDKLNLLASARGQLGDRLLTVHIAQGHYARASLSPNSIQPNQRINNISELLSCGPRDFDLAATN